jgi:hypothetical protein
MFVFSYLLNPLVWTASLARNSVLFIHFEIIFGLLFVAKRKNIPPYLRLVHTHVYMYINLDKPIISIGLFILSSFSSANLLVLLLPLYHFFNIVYTAGCILVVVLSIL